MKARPRAPRGVLRNERRRARFARGFEGEGLCVAREEESRELVGGRGRPGDLPARKKAEVANVRGSRAPWENHETNNNDGDREAARSVLEATPAASAAEDGTSAAAGGDGSEELTCPARDSA